MDLDVKGDGYAFQSIVCLPEWSTRLLLGETILNSSTIPRYKAAWDKSQSPGLRA